MTNPTPKRPSRTVAAPLAAGLVLAVTLAFGCGSDAGGSNPASPAGASSSGGFGPSSDAGNIDASGFGPSCVTSSKRAESIPVDIGLALDTSFSMDFDEKWINTKSALKAFVGNPAYEDLSLALQFFPVRKQCNVAEYALPAVPTGPLPSVASQVRDALDAQSMDGGTPMVQVLQGMTDYMRAHAAAAGGHKPVILLATDGLPDETCEAPSDSNTPNSLDNAVKQVAAALGGSPSIPTFVIGVGTELGALDQLAAAGGTTKAILVDPTKNLQESFLQALDTVRRNALACDYPLPAGSEPIDPTKVNVTYSASSGAVDTFAFVGTADQCSKGNDKGYYFDNPAAPATVVLCPNACDRLKADPSGEVDVVFGCARVDVR
jgi:hypothetical protein